MDSDFNVQAPIPFRANTVTPSSSLLGLNLDSNPSSRTNSPHSTSEGGTPIQINESLLYRARNRTSWVWKHENGLPYRVVDLNGMVRERWRCARCMLLHIILVNILANIYLIT